jgi:hypothetical protein
MPTPGWNKANILGGLLIGGVTAAASVATVLISLKARSSPAGSPQTRSGAAGSPQSPAGSPQTRSGAAGSPQSPTGSPQTRSGAAGSPQSPAGSPAKPDNASKENSHCRSNTDCDDVCIQGVCRPRSSEGGPCDESGPWDCENGLRCVNETCMKKLALGMRCTSNIDCLDTCVRGLCAVRSAAGGACDNDFFDCSDGLRCVEDKCVNRLPSRGP